MFSDTSIIKEVNILSKVIAYFLVLIMVIICKDNFYILFIDIFGLIITKKYHDLFNFNLFLTSIIIFSFVLPPLLWITKICLLVIYTILLSKVTRLIELRYVIETLFYGFKNKKITYKLFYIIYFFKSFKRHFKWGLSLKNEYGLKLSPSFIFFIIKQSYIKAMIGKNDFLEINNQRFYNYSNTRTYMEKITWESWDTTYLICHVLVLFVTIFYGR